jgi:hypothetical protein
MYFMDFYRAKTQSDKYFLTGTDEFLKILAQDKISSDLEFPIQRIRDKEELKQIVRPLFGGARILLVPSNINVKVWPVYTIKLSDKRMPAALKKAGFEEVLCNGLFPNQVRSLTQIFLDKQRIQHDKQLILDLCNLNRYDVYSIYNTIQLYSFTPEQSLDQVGPALISVDLYKTMDMFMDGNLTDFMVSAEASKVKIRDLVLSMITVINKMVAALALKGELTWYQNKLQSAAQLYGIHRLTPLLNMLNKIYIDHETSSDIHWLKLKRSLIDIGGC